MSNLIISGASDDLVEIDGLISDEFNVYRPAVVTVKVDDAVFIVVAAEYDRDNDDEWRIEVAGNFPSALVSWMKAIGEDNTDVRRDADGVASYSDKLVIHMGDVEARRVNVTCEEAR